jgi:hypothetical protein
MKVTIEKKVTETVNVEPGYYKNRLLDCFYHLRESGVLVYVSNTMIYFTTPDKGSCASDLKEIINDCRPCDQSEFEAAKDKLLIHLKHYVSFPETASALNPAKGAVINTMNIQDPNAPQQEPAKEATEQATNEAATESAAQDAAMGVDSEEGGVEG